MTGTSHHWPSHSPPRGPHQKLAGAPRSPSTPAAGPIGELPTALLARTVLIVEDEAMIAWLIETLLEEMGFSSVRVTGTAEQAIAAARDDAPALIVSDINLGPGQVDGVSAAATLRAAAPVPVVFVTGYAGPEIRARIRRDVPGALVLRKPVQSEELRRAIVRLLAPHATH